MDCNRKDSSALVVFSGGQDSTTMLYWAKSEFDHVETLCFRYGQNHVQEVEVARALAQEAGVHFRVVDLSFIGELSVNALTSDGLTMDSEKPKDKLPNTFVPGRNLFFLSSAAVVARELGIKDLVTGVSQTDFSGYPDCRDNFIKSLNVTLNLAMEYDFRIHTPLMWLDKCETWAMADSLGVLEIIRDKTLTCYRGVIGSGCGNCPSCLLRNAGLSSYLETIKKKK